MLKNREEAEDIIQNVFMKLWTMQDKIDKYEDPAALAMVMVRNSCIDVLRKWKHLDPAEYDSTASKVEHGRTPFELLVNNENSRIISGIIDRLPDIYRNAITMRDIQGLEYEEIASLSNVNVNTVRVTISRGRLMIREQYLKLTDERRKTERIVE